MSREFDHWESNHTPVEEAKPVVRRKKKRRKRNFLREIKKGIIWGISISIALLAIILAIFTYKL